MVDLLMQNLLDLSPPKALAKEQEAARSACREA